jgi:hypothetical protein
MELGEGVPELAALSLRKCPGISATISLNIEIISMSTARTCPKFKTGVGLIKRESNGPV